MSAAVDAVRSLHRAMERGVHGEELRPFFTPDAVTVEHPNAIAPAGGTHDLATMVEMSERGHGLLASQTYDEVAAEAVGDDLAVIRLRWAGTVAADLGPFRAGQQLVAHIAQFVTVVDGRISRLETYDCYEPFA
jgi:ketosteroid isomerase-like protein